MDNFAAYGSAYLLGLSALFAAIKCIRTIGAIHRGDLFAYWGRGNSLSVFIAKALTGTWGLLALANFFAMMWFFTPEGPLHITDSTGISSKAKKIEPDQKHLSPGTESIVERSAGRQVEQHGSLVNSKDARQLTAEEIRQSESEKQYTGDDPIIRERLGLPPKSDQ